MSSPPSQSWSGVPEGNRTASTPIGVSSLQDTGPHGPASSAESSRTEPFHHVTLADSRVMSPTDSLRGIDFPGPQPQVVTMPAITSGGQESNLDLQLIARSPRNHGLIQGLYGSCSVCNMNVYEPTCCAGCGRIGHVQCVRFLSAQHAWWLPKSNAGVK